ncbi:MAG: hypothetical protein U0487_01440 [Patescibacteria group bacterium]
MDAIDTVTSTDDTSILKPGERHCRRCVNPFTPADPKYRVCPGCHQAILLERFGEPCVDCEKLHIRRRGYKGEFSRCEDCLKLDAEQRERAKRLREALDEAALQRLEAREAEQKKDLADPFRRQKADAEARFRANAQLFCAKPESLPNWFTLHQQLGRQITLKIATSDKPVYHSFILELSRDEKRAQDEAAKKRRLDKRHSTESTQKQGDSKRKRGTQK